MGSGIAKTIREIYPKAYEDYREFYERQQKLFLGQVISSDCGDRTILNCITQENYGRDGKLYLSYDAPKCIDVVGFPLIGCGLAGGKWTIVEKIFEEYAAFDVEVWKL